MDSTPNSKPGRRRQRKGSYSSTIEPSPTPQTTSPIPNGNSVSGNSATVTNTMNLSGSNNNINTVSGNNHNNNHPHHHHHHHQHDTSFTESIDSAEKGLTSQSYSDTTAKLTGPESSSTSEKHHHNEQTILSSIGSESSSSAAYAALNGSKLSSGSKQTVSPCFARCCSCLLIILSLCLLIGIAFIGGFIASKYYFFSDCDPSTHTFCFNSSPSSTFHTQMPNLSSASFDSTISNRNSRTNFNKFEPKVKSKIITNLVKASTPMVTPDPTTTEMTGEDAETESMYDDLLTEAPVIASTTTTTTTIPSTATTASTPTTTSSTTTTESTNSVSDSPESVPNSDSKPNYPSILYSGNDTSSDNNSGDNSLNDFGSSVVPSEKSTTQIPITTTTTTTTEAAITTTMQPTTTTTSTTTTTTETPITTTTPPTITTTSTESASTEPSSKSFSTITTTPPSSSTDNDSVPSTTPESLSNDSTPSASSTINNYIEEMTPRIMIEDMAFSESTTMPSTMKLFKAPSESSNETTTVSLTSTTVPTTTTSPTEITETTTMIITTTTQINYRQPKIWTKEFIQARKNLTLASMNATTNQLNGKMDLSEIMNLSRPEATTTMRPEEMTTTPSPSTTITTVRTLAMSNESPASNSNDSSYVNNFPVQYSDSKNVTITTVIDKIEPTANSSETESLQPSENGDENDFTNVTEIFSNSSSTSHDQTGKLLAGKIFCLESQFMCPNDTTEHCYDRQLLCDGIANCPDGFDEQNCRKLSCGLNFMCNSTLRMPSPGVEREFDNSTVNDNDSVQCIPKKLYCDGIWDCLDGSDEIDCKIDSCSMGQLQCKDGSACIQAKQICDGFYNCRDHSDELGCESRSSCENSSRFYCNDSLCIDKSLVCDGRSDCQDGSDEHNCVSEESCTESGSKFFCSGQCLDANKRCDGIVDCWDYSDEDRCFDTDPSGIVHIYDPTANMWSLYCVNNDPSTFDSLSDELCVKIGKARSMNASTFVVSRMLANSTWSIVNSNEQPLSLSSLSPSSSSPSLSSSSSTSSPVSSSSTPLIANSTTPIHHSPYCSSKTAIQIECEPLEMVHKSSTIERPNIPQPLLLKPEIESQLKCSSFAIASKWILTSGHCALHLKKLNSKLLITNNASSWTTEVTEIRIHPRYTTFRTIHYPDYDLALVKVKDILPESVLRSSSIKLPEVKPDPEITCFLEDGESEFKVLESSVCNSSQHFDGLITGNALCASGPDIRKPAPCSMPFSPLLCLTAKQEWYLSGFTSYQRGCSDSLTEQSSPTFRGYISHPVIFSNVFSMSSFISQSLGSGMDRISRPIVRENFVENGTEILHDHGNRRAAYVKLDDEILSSNNAVDENNNSREQKSFNITNSVTNSTTESTIIENSAVLAQQSPKDDKQNATESVPTTTQASTTTTTTTTMISTTTIQSMDLGDNNPTIQNLTEYSEIKKNDDLIETITTMMPNYMNSESKMDTTSSTEASSSSETSSSTSTESSDSVDSSSLTEVPSSSETPSSETTETSNSTKTSSSTESSSSTETSSSTEASSSTESSSSTETSSLASMSTESAVMLTTEIPSASEADVTSTPTSFLPNTTNVIDVA